MTGDTLEALAFHSGNVHKVFYEKLLGRLISDMPDDAKMLDYVWDGVCADFGQTYTDICSGTLYIFPNVTWPGEGGKELSSTVSGSFEKSGNRSIRKFIIHVFDWLEDEYSPKPFPAPTPVPPDEYPPEEDTAETEETWETEETTEPIESDEVPGTEAPWY